MLATRCSVDGIRIEELLLQHTSVSYKMLTHCWHEDGIKFEALLLEHICAFYIMLSGNCSRTAE